MLPCPQMMKAVGYILTAMSALAWGAEEVQTYAQGFERVGEDGWVLLCHSADWDSSHDEQWMRRQTSIRSSCGGALVLYVPVYQNPTPEQAAAAEEMLQGSRIDFSQLRSVPCALLLDRDGRPYATVGGEEFAERAAGRIREAQAQLRIRNDLLRRAASEEGSQRAQTLSSIWRLSIAPPPNLKAMMQAADPEDSAGIAEWSPFDPQKLAERVRTLPLHEAMAEFDRVQAAQLSKEERQAVLAIRMGCVHHHLGVAGAQELHRLASACSALSPGSPLGRAALRAAEIWGNRLRLEGGWRRDELPLLAADCDIAGTQVLARAGEFRVGIVATGGEDPVRVTRVTLYDGSTKVSEDVHTCCVKPGEEAENNEYMLILRLAPTHPRLVISFDQQERRDTEGYFTLRHFDEDGIERFRHLSAPEQARQAADKAREEVSRRDFNAEEQNTPSEDAAKAIQTAPPALPEDATGADTAEK